VPNICENELSIYADGDQQEALLKTLTKRVKSKESVFDFNKLVPSPDWDNTPNEDGEFPVIDEDAPAFMQIKKFPLSGKSDDRWYDWRCTNWGTKWGACEIEITQDDEDFLEITFNTAWSPPEPIVEALRSKYECKDEDSYSNGKYLSVSWLYELEGEEGVGYL